MTSCPLCHSRRGDDLCDTCGYSYARDAIADRERLRAWSRRGRWVQMVQSKLSVHDYFMGRLGQNTSSADRHGWSQSRTADLFGEDRSTIAKQLKLARALEHHPELGEKQTVDDAQKALQRIERGIQPPSMPFKTEPELQRYLAPFITGLPPFTGWRLENPERDGKANTDVGIIDFLMVRDPGEWFVVELKWDEPGDRAVGQLLRYVGWVVCNRADGNADMVHGAILCGRADAHLHYSALAARWVRVFEWRWTGDAVALDEYNPRLRRPIHAQDDPLTQLARDLHEGRISKEELERLLKEKASAIQSGAP